MLKTTDSAGDGGADNFAVPSKWIFEFDADLQVDHVVQVKRDQPARAGDWRSGLRSK